MFVNVFFYYAEGNTKSFYFAPKITYKDLHCSPKDYPPYTDLGSVGNSLIYFRYLITLYESFSAKKKVVCLVVIKLHFESASSELITKYEHKMQFVSGSRFSRLSCAEEWEFSHWLTTNIILEAPAILKQ